MWNCYSFSRNEEKIDDIYSSVSKNKKKILRLHAPFVVNNLFLKKKKNLQNFTSFRFYY